MDVVVSFPIAWGQIELVECYVENSLQWRHPLYYNNHNDDDDHNFDDDDDNDEDDDDDNDDNDDDYSNGSSNMFGKKNSSCGCLPYARHD